MKKVKGEKGAIAVLVVVTVLMFVLILMGTYMAIANLRKSQLESDIRIQELYGGDVARIEEVYNTVSKSITGGLEVGDYIEYNSGINGTILCRVLYAPDSEYGLQIISDKSVKNVTLGGSTFEEGRSSYNNAIETLNNEAEAYINKEYAVDARCVGSVPTVENGIFLDKNSEVLGPVKLDFTYNGSTTIDCKATDENYVKDREQLEKFQLNTIGELYWLASRITISVSPNYYLAIHCIRGDGSFAYYGLCNIVRTTGNTFGGVHTGGLRPCFSLKTSIKIISGDGSESNPYIME